MDELNKLTKEEVDELLIDYYELAQNESDLVDFLVDISIIDFQK